MSLWIPGTVSTRELAATGYPDVEIARMVRSGTISRLRRGAYTGKPADPSPAGQIDRHRRLIEATIGLCADGAVISHRSAAVLWGLRLSRVPARIEVTRPDSAHGRDRGCVHVLVASLPAAEVTMLNGHLVTTLARTVVDLARSLPMLDAVVSGDSALAAGLGEAELADSLDRARGRRGVVRARRTCGFLDGRSESGGESVSRVRLAGAGLPAPTLQYEVFDVDGVLIGRSDFCWEEYRTLGEFDGRLKYGRLLKPGQSPADAVWAEKRREDALRDTGRQLVRWIWEDLRSMDNLVAGIRRAFARGR